MWFLLNIIDPCDILPFGRIYFQFVVSFTVQMVRVLDARFAILNSNKTDVTIEAGIAHPYRVPEFTRVFVGFVLHNL